jgi:hypothetical protein
MKFICEECAEPCILDTGDHTSLEVANLTCIIKNSCYCNWKKYENGECENLQPTCNQLATNLPKLPEEVFNRPDYPVWAQIAVVNRNGKAYYGGYKDARINCSGGWQGFYDEQGKWKRIGNELFDASDWQNSLIERPKNRVNWDEVEEICCNSKLTFKEKKQELPDWCKVGEWVYLCNGTYSRIVSINDCHVNLENGISVGKNSIHEEMVPARLRPYNAEEMRGLVGKVIEKGPSMHIVTGFENVFDNECMVHVNGCLYSAEDLLRQFTIDNAPCGVLEHLENGEGVI